MGKDLDQATYGSLTRDLGTVAETERVQAPPERLGTQSAIATETMPVGWVWCRLEAAKDGSYLPIARAASGLVGDSKWRVDGDETG
jgi:hypothetical protein